MQTSLKPAFAQIFSFPKFGAAAARLTPPPPPGLGPPACMPMHLWWQFFQMFIYGDVVYAQTWPVLTLKNCIEPLSSASMAYVVAWYGPSFFSTVL